MFASTPCRICDETGHKASKCPELSSNKPPTPQRGGHGDDEDDSLTNSGKWLAQEVSQTNGSNAGQWNPLSVISI
jgi:hypothetical protein